MDEYVEEAMHKWNVPGLAIAVVKDGQVVLANGFGVCRIGQDRKVSAETVFDIASCAKSFVAASVGILVEDGKLHWDDPIRKHLPEFELADPYRTEHATIRDLLCHRTGVQRCDLLADRADFDAGQIISRLKFLPLAAEFRTKLIYSNPMYVVLSEVVTRASGKPWEQFATERIFRPLGMNSTWALAEGVPAHRFAPRHWRSDAGIVARDSPLRAGRRKGSSHSTVNDLARWVKLQLAEGRFEGHHVIDRETVRELQALQFSVPVKSRPRDNIYAAQLYGSGLGWFVQDYRGRKVVTHSGAWGAMVGMMPEEGLGVVVLSNLDLESLPGLFMYDVFDAYLVGAEFAWDTSKWEKTWLKNEPPGHAYRLRDEAKARLEKLRIASSLPAMPLEHYAGSYESKLYGPLVVRHDVSGLTVRCADFATPMSHWQGESFYVRSPTRLTFDWLITFQTDGDMVESLLVKHIGWDKDEHDHLFVRQKK
jgi:CubicO group peptidase (beta-lactamase class C family)